MHVLHHFSLQSLRSRCHVKWHLAILKRCKLFSNHSLRLKMSWVKYREILTFKVWFENNLHSSIMKVFYCAIGFCWSHCDPFCTPKPDLCMRVDLPLDKKLWKIRTGPSGHLGRRALGRGPSGLLLAKPDLLYWPNGRHSKLRKFHKNGLILPKLRPGSNQ